VGCGQYGLLPAVLLLYAVEDDEGEEEGRAEKEVMSDV
jgi:hypothetical protein